MSGIVYHIFNTKNGKAYIGQTWRRLSARWWEHQNRPRCVALFGAIQKYGPESFVKTILATLDKQQDLDAAEIYWAKYFDTYAPNGYNIREAGGGHGPLPDEVKSKISSAHMGMKASAAARAKMSLFQKGKFVSEEARRNMSIAQKGRKHTIEEIEKIRRAHMGKCHTAESKSKISEAALKRFSDPNERVKASVARKAVKVSQETYDEVSLRLRRRQVVDKDGRVYLNASQAEKAWGLPRCSVSQALRNGGLAGGMEFRYV